MPILLNVTNTHSHTHTLRCAAAYGNLWLVIVVGCVCAHIYSELWRCVKVIAEQKGECLPCPYLLVWNRMLYYFLLIRHACDMRTQIRINNVTEHDEWLPHLSWIWRLLVSTNNLCSERIKETKKMTTTTTTPNTQKLTDGMDECGGTLTHPQPSVLERFFFLLWIVCHFDCGNKLYSWKSVGN